MMATFVQVVGIAGIAETLVEFSYALANLKDFTPFEYVFFLVSGSVEMFTVLIVMGIMARTMLKKNNIADACRVAKYYLRDPIHVICFPPWREEEGYDADLEAGAFIAIFYPFWPTFSWWLVLTFGTGFKSDGDRDLMLTLSVVSLCSLLLFLVTCIPSGWDDVAKYPLLASFYSVPKVFELYLLASRQERLASSKLGVMLIYLQVLEVLSCAFIVSRYILKYLELSQARESNPGHRRCCSPLFMYRAVPVPPPPR